MDIEERAMRLERQNRNLKKGIILAVVFIGGFFGLGQMAPAKDYRIQSAIRDVASAIDAQNRP